MKIVNRTAIFVEALPPFVDWVNDTDEEGMEFTLESVNEDANVYLVDEIGEDEDPEDLVGDVFTEIFERELEGWCEDEEEWPDTEDYDLFLDWFDVRVGSIVLDLSGEKLLREKE